jgi:transposase
MNQKRQYPAAKIPDESKTLCARLYQVQHAAGKTRKEFIRDMHLAGYDVSERQLDRWVARINAGEVAVSTAKASGATLRLTREERNVIGGWVLRQNLHGAPVHLADYSAFCKKHFNKPLSKQTALRYLHEDGFSYRTLKRRAKGFSIDVESQRRMAWQWVQKHRAAGLFDVSQDLLA